MEISNFDDVGRFHAKFGLPEVTFHDPYPHALDDHDEVMLFRIKFMLEELDEFISAAGFSISLNTDGGFMVSRMDGVKQDHAGMFDALIDLCYVAFGTAHLEGYPWQQGWNLVQAANMTKVRAKKKEESERGGTWDVVKPADFTAPDIAGLLRQYGWTI